MAKAISRILVVDANILRAAGKSGDPLALICADVLTSIYEICHRASESTTLRDEWDKHASRFGIRWRASMLRRGKIEPVPEDSNVKSLREAIVNSSASPKQIEQMVKDVHLVDAARASNGAVLSCDDTVRVLFRQATGTIKKLAPIVWVNPASADEIVMSWLSSGAPDDDHRKLGSG